MKNTYKKELMQQCYNDYKSGKPVPVLIQEYNIPRSTLYTQYSLYLDKKIGNNSTKAKLHQKRIFTSTK